ncbi:hypothetical protein HMI54_008142 [Coelomomyces lativittatus]|nr:hypothetical protein HMI54_008142 [Coelomomyces lativittatus]
MDHRNDYYASLLLTSLVFAPKHEFIQDDPTGLVDKIYAYIEQRTSSESRQHLVQALSPWNPAQVTTQQDYLSVQRQQAQYAFEQPHLPITTWPTLLPKPDTPLLMKTFTLPPHLTVSHFFAPPYVCARIFEDHPITFPWSNSVFQANVPPLEAMERMVTMDLLYDFLNNIQNNPKEGVKWLLDIKLLFLTNTFTNTPLEIVGNQHGVHPDQPGYQFEQLLVEALFTHLFRLPLSQVRPIFYTDVMMGLCKLAPTLMAPALGKAIQLCFYRLPSMDMDGFLRFADFFAHHLSLFSFTWNWKDWSSFVSLPDSVEYRFLCTVLIKMTRLAYFDRILQSLPPSFTELYTSLEPKPCEELTKNMDSTFQAFAASFMDMLPLKPPQDELEQYVQQFQKNSQADWHQVRSCTFMCLLKYGQATVSHTMTVLERYVPLLHVWTMEGSHSHPTWAYLEAVFEVWQRHSQFFLIVLEKIIQYRLVTPLDVLMWTFELLPFQNTPNAPLFFLEVLCLTIRKALHRIDYVEDKLKSAIENHESDEIVEKLERNLTKANQEKRQLFLFVVQNLLQMFTSHLEGSQLTEDQRTHWQHWVLGSLVSVVRMYVADFDSALKNEILQCLEAEASTLPLVIQVLTAVLSME